MMVKLNKIEIKGLRGVRNELSLNLNGKSALIYGDNGSGKSSIADVLEWFFFDRIEHLTGEEIGRKGYEALRNIFLSDDQAGTLLLEFNRHQLNNQKKIEIERGNIKASMSNESEDFNEYLSSSRDENLSLRYKELVTFVLSSKTDKLRALSEIIGYSKVTDTRDVFRTVFNRLSREIKTKGFDNSINHQQNQIIEQLGQNITTNEQFIEVVSVIVKPFELGIKISRLADINEVLKKIKKPDDSKIIKQEIFLNKILENTINLPNNLNDLEIQYKEYKRKFDQIVLDAEKLKKLSIEKLLAAGNEILLSESYSDDACPLCEQHKKKEDLINEIKSRIIELEEIKKENKDIADSNSLLQKQIQDTLEPLNAVLNDKLIEEESNEFFKTNLTYIISAIKKYSDPLKIKINDSKTLIDEEALLVKRTSLESLTDKCTSELEAIKKARKTDPKWEAYSKISTASHAYAQILRLRKERLTFEKQRDTMETIYRNFLAKQKEALEAFLDTFSEKIDEIYQFLNPNEKVENIKLVPLEKDNELAGITIQFDFLDKKDVTPPHKFLSESHINCLGLAFFLTSVEAFNKQNKFVILDDVISSFDANHRKRFADLLIEKYSDFQLIMLTHEKTWFDIVKNLVKNKNWQIQTVKYHQTNGTYMDDSPQTLKERILAKIENHDEQGLGNDARKYLEHILKQIAVNLEVKVAYRSNEVNEDRMAFELLTELKSTIKKRNCTELGNQAIIDRLLSSLFIGNKDSHHNASEPTFSDMKAFWQDVIEFEQIFFCDECKTPVSLRFYDVGAKKISCKNKELEYSWNK